MYTTKKTLLQKLQENDDISWSEFYGLYAPLVFTVGKRLGMMQEDCEDLMQEIMFTLFHGKEILQYDESRGKFRTYFGQIVYHKAVKMLRKSARSSFSALARDMMTKNMPDCRMEDDPFHEVFDEEYNSYLLTLALNELRTRIEPGTYDIFEMVVLQGRSPKEVARHLDISRAVIDVYCSRCRKKLQKIISDIRIDNPDFNPELPL